MRDITQLQTFEKQVMQIIRAAGPHITNIRASELAWWLTVIFWPTQVGNGSALHDNPRAPADFNIAQDEFDTVLATVLLIAAADPTPL